MPSTYLSDPPQSPSHYLVVDISQCDNLQLLSLQIHYYTPDGWYPPIMHDSRADVDVVAFLRDFLRRPMPSSTCLDMKLCGGRNIFGLEMVGFDEIERLLFQFHGDCKTKTRSLVLTSWWGPKCLERSGTGHRGYFLSSLAMKSLNVSYE